MESVYSQLAVCLPGTKTQQIGLYTKDFLMRFEARRCPGQPTGTRNRTGELVRVGRDTPGELSSIHPRVLRIPDSIFSRQPASPHAACISGPRVPDGSVEVQPGRTLARRADPEADPPGRASEHLAIGEGHPPLHRRGQPAPETIGVDQDGRQDPYERYPPFSANL